MTPLTVQQKQEEIGWKPTSKCGNLKVKPKHWMGARFQRSNQKIPRPDSWLNLYVLLKVLKMKKQKSEHSARPATPKH